MTELGLKTFSWTKPTIRHSLWLITAHFTYRILTFNVLQHFIPWAFTLVMLFLPIFCFLLQQNMLYKAATKPSNIVLLVSSAIMILLCAIAVSVIVFTSHYIGLSSVISGKEFGSAPSLLNLLKNHITWYLIFGIPGALLARLVLYLKNEAFKK